MLAHMRRIDQIPEPRACAAMLKVAASSSHLLLNTGNCTQAPPRARLYTEQDGTSRPKLQDLRRPTSAREDCRIHKTGPRVHRNLCTDQNPEFKPSSPRPARVSMVAFPQRPSGGTEQPSPDRLLLHGLDLEECWEPSWNPKVSRV